ncbi:MAG TPA: threonine--tRNA ligase [Alphaproteobacteria bacterium]|jgi:threonyl-tRNA synthetase|nr:threonine--tRNA ligase [Alphaproteobacteria bacterium]
MKSDKEYLDHLRHSCAHLLAAAVIELWPGTKRTIGPAIENGFYYDFDFGDIKISEADFPKIEEKMQQILKDWDHWQVREVSEKEAKEEYKDNPYKKELIEEIVKKGEKITFYAAGGENPKSQFFWDLCRGGHADEPSKELKHFKLLSVAGAYWRGNEKNKMLTRIYGTCFSTKDELYKYLEMLKEAEKRNHKKIGLELGLFMFHETAPGMTYWLPKGVILYNELIKFWREEHQKEGYQEIVSPLINKKELYETSGHWEHYLQDMFISKTDEGETYALKPMNCPNAMVVFGYKTRSYRELPLRLSDTDTLHRNEMSGTLNGLLRIREFKQDDAHMFVTEEQIKSEFEKLFALTEKFYSIFGLEYRFRLGTRPDKFMGDPKLWDKAEKEIKEVLEKSGKEFFILEGDGAFYGPKIDILMKDSLGRDWQMGTLQLDMQIPGRFGLKYSAEDGTEKTPVVIHRVIYGSLERFIGIITEHFGGNFPTWINPIQVKILPITDKHNEYAETVVRGLKNAGIRAELDDRNERLQGKIRDAQMEKVSYMLIIGDKEQEAESVAIRKRSGEDLGSKSVEEFVELIKKEIEEKTI